MVRAIGRMNHTDFCPHSVLYGVGLLARTTWVYFAFVLGTFSY